MRNLLSIFVAVFGTFLLSFAVIAHAIGTPIQINGGGTGSTTAPTGQVLYGGGGTGLNKAYQSAPTTTLSAGTGVSFSGTPGYLIGGTNLTISASGSGNGNVATSTTEAQGQLPYWTSTGATPATLGKVATTSLTLTSFPANLSAAIGALVGGNNATWTYWGLSTTSQPSSSNLLVSNGTNGVFGVATGTVSAGSSAITVTAGRSAIGGALAIDCATASGSQAGCLSSTDWTTFNSKGSGTVTSVTGTWPIASSGGNTPAISWVGLATTSQPASSNLLVSNGTTGIYGIATSTLTANNGLTGTLTQLGSGGALGLATINAGVLGAQANGAVPSSQATSTLYGAASTGGFVLQWSNTTNGLVLAATSTSGGGSGTVTSIATNNGLTGGTITTSGTIGLAALGSAGVLGAPTAAIPTVQATSTLYGNAPYNGYVLGYNTSGGAQWMSTSTIDVFLIGGQSNAVGEGNASSSMQVASGTAYQYYNGAITLANDPVGPAGNQSNIPAGALGGSAWPAFAVAYTRATGHRIGFVPAAVAGSSMEYQADDGHGNWDVPAHGGTLYGTSNTLLTSAMTAYRNYGFAPVFKGILWSQGEADASNINAGTVGVSQANYISAFETMITNYKTIYGTSTPLYIFETGNVGSVQSDAGYAQIRAAQELVARSAASNSLGSDTYAKLVFQNALSFQTRGLMQADQIHYSQFGYNEMGTVGASNVTSYGSNLGLQQAATTTNNLFYSIGNVAIGTTTTALAQLTVSSPTSTPPTSVLLDVASTTTATPLLQVQANGNVGIGTANPVNQLQVETDQNAGTSANISNSTSGTAAFTSLSQVAGTVSSWLYNISQGYTTSNQYIAASALLESNGAGGVGLSTSGSGAYAPIKFWTGSTVAERMRITPSGAVGIGTTSPSAQLAISTTSQSAGNTRLFAIGSTTASVPSLLAVLGNGNIGIGTDNPINLLQIEHDYNGGNTGFNLGNTTNGTGAFTQYTSSAGGNASFIYTFAPLYTSSNQYIGDSMTIDTSGSQGLNLSATGAGAGAPIRLWINSVEKMRVALNGDVGIGTTTPGSPLTVSGTGTWNSTGGGILDVRSTGSPTKHLWMGYDTTIDAGFIQASNDGIAHMPLVINGNGGNVGIASSTPWRTLGVGGTVGFSGLTTSSGTQAGVLCLSSNKEVINDSVACLASAARYKQNVNPLTVGLAEVLKLQPVSFLWKPDFNGADQNDPNFSGVQYSLIADDVQKIDPRLVSVTTATTTFEGKTYPAGTVQGLADVNHWVALFVQSFHDLVARLTGDEAQIKALKAQVAKQQSEIDAINAKLK